MLAQAPQGDTNETGSQPCLLELGIFRRLLFQDQPLWVSFLYAGDEPTGAQVLSTWGMWRVQRWYKEKGAQEEGTLCRSNPLWEPIVTLACRHSMPQL